MRAGRVVVVFKNGAPIEVVRDASRRKVANDFDHAWAVCDVDEFDTERAAVEARRKGVGLAWSNPCFELWLILHVAEQTSHLDNGDKAGERISKVLGKEYDKGTLNFTDFEAGIAAAVKRAKLLGPPPVANPSTNMWAVLESLGFRG
ncbi:RloB family protein [Actinoplanes sp. CA-054009]